MIIIRLGKGNQGRYSC